MKVVGLVRVSTEQQSAGGVSLEAQRAKLAAYCAALDLELVAVFQDVGSAKSLERPGLTAALAALERGDAEGLLVTKLDRLTRSIRDLAFLLERYFEQRFALLSVGDAIDTRSAAGRLILNVLTSVAAWERETCSERTKAALAHLKARGVRLGAPALTDPAVVGKICELRERGLTLEAICAALTAEGLPTKRGGAWRPSVVLGVLRRAA